MKKTRGGSRKKGGAQEMNAEPHIQRRGWLKNGNQSGDCIKAARCEAKTRRGTKCQGPAMRNGRCRMHGWCSTGPRTPGGLERSRKARWIHGWYSREVRDERRESRRLLRALAALLDGSE